MRLRTDARRNREVILRVADEAFAEGAEVVPLEEIARRTGLGRATVYRHFPDRYALGVAIVAEQLAAWRRIVEAAEGDHRSFRQLLHLVLSDQISRRPLVRLFREMPGEQQRQYADSLIGVLAPAFRRAQAAGELRADLEPADLVLVLEMVEAAVTTPIGGTDHDAAVQRLIEVVLDGLSG